MCSVQVWALCAMPWAPTGTWEHPDTPSSENLTLAEDAIREQDALMARLKKPFEVAQGDIVAPSSALTRSL